MIIYTGFKAHQITQKWFSLTAGLISGASGVRNFDDTHFFFKTNIGIPSKFRGRPPAMSNESKLRLAGISSVVDAHFHLKRCDLCRRITLFVPPSKALTPLFSLDKKASGSRANCRRPSNDRDTKLLAVLYHSQSIWRVKGCKCRGSGCVSGISRPKARAQLRC